MSTITKRNNFEEQMDFLEIGAIEWDGGIEIVAGIPQE